MKNHLLWRKLQKLFYFEIKPFSRNSLYQNSSFKKIHYSEKLLLEMLSQIKSVFLSFKIGGSFSEFFQNLKIQIGYNI